MDVEAIVLAGAPNDKALRQESDAPLEALIEVEGRPMVAYVLDALRGCSRIRRIALVGPEEPLRPLQDERGMPSVHLAGDAGDLVGNLQRGLDFLAADGPVLVVTSDIPLLIPAAVDDFLDRCFQVEADVYYPIISRSDCEARFPGVERTYAKLADGEFTGGNCLLLAPEVLTRHRHVIEQAVAMRKNPLALSRLFGLGLFLKLALGRLHIAEVERHFQRAFGLRGVAVRCPFPEIGFDVDKPSDLRLARRLLARPPADRHGPR